MNIGVSSQLVSRLQEALQQGCVLVIEPTDNYRATIKRYLQNLGITDAKYVSSVKEAKTELHFTNASLIICEWKQGGGENGLQFCRSIRTNDRYWKTPFLLISVESLRSDIVLASEVGVDGYLLKPFSYEDFCEQLRMVITSSSDRISFTQMLNAAEAYLERHEYEHAEKLFKECQEFDLQSARVQCGIGQIRAAETNTDAAVQCYVSALEANPSYLEAYRLILDIYEHEGNPHRTLHYALKAHELSPDNPRYLLMIAKAYLMIGELKESETFFRKVILRSPKMAAGYKGLGDVHMLQEDYEKAMKSYQKALDLDGYDVGILNSMGLVFIKQSRYEEGIKRYKLALGIEQNNPKVLFNLGHAFERLGQYQQARSYFNRSLISDPDFDKARRGLERTDRMLKKPAAS